MNKDKYRDIIDMPYPIFGGSSKIKGVDRAAQFASFAALTGYEDEIAEKGRLTDEKTELDENRIDSLNEKLMLLKSFPEKLGEAVIEYFVPDKLKCGGKYVVKKGYVKNIDEYKHSVNFYDGTVIAITDIYDIRLLHDVPKFKQSSE